MDNLRALLAASGNFQTLVGAGSAEAAKRSIYRTAVPAPLGIKRPYAVITHAIEAGFRYDFIAAGAKHHFINSGDLHMRIVRDTPLAYQASEADGEMDFLNVVDEILDDMLTMSGNGYMAIMRLEREDGPRHSHPAEEASEGDYYEATYRVEWGLRG